MSSDARRAPLLPILILSIVIPACGADDSTDEGTWPPVVDASSPSPSPLEPGGPETPVLIVSDGGYFRAHFIRTDLKTVFYDFNAAEAFEDCQLEDGEACTITELHHSVHEGGDYLDVNVSLLEGATLRPGSVRRVRLTDPPTPVFTLDRFDFSALANASDFCPQDPDDPCRRSGDPRCSIWFPHDLQVLSDDPSSGRIEFLITDILSQRVMKVDYDYSSGSTCGKVEWQLSAWQGDFEQLALPNSADYFVEDGQEYLLVGFYSTEPVYGAGRSELWRRPSPDGAWERVWTFPRAEESDTVFLNSPHAPFFHETPSGDRYLIYGHSRGRSEYWGYGYKGSIGVARVDDLESLPTYLFDAVFPDADPMSPMGFVRDIEPLSDGRFLVTDSGCLLFLGCPLEGRVYITSFDFEQEAAGLSGGYTPEGVNQSFVNLDMTALESYTCGMSTLYESDVTSLGALGDDLGARIDEVVRTCPD